VIFLPQRRRQPWWLKLCEDVSLSYFETNALHFALMLLDSQHKVLECTVLFSGTIDGAAIYPREIAKAALYANAAGVILAHNHPSGQPVPSAADKRITVRIKDALALLDIRVLDHIIVGDSCYSFAQSGEL
jgi:DNA repair protein RadC